MNNRWRRVKRLRNAEKSIGVHVGARNTVVKMAKVADKVSSESVDWSELGKSLAVMGTVTDIYSNAEKHSFNWQMRQLKRIVKDMLPNSIKKYFKA